jgi:hypothetical protein
MCHRRVMEPALLDEKGVRLRRTDGVLEKTGGSEHHERSEAMYNIFYIIGVIVVILAILGYLGLR